eukprot:gene24129-31352_t
MGGDGGVIANQRKYLRSCAEAKTTEAEVVERDALIERTKFCSFSSQPLTEPIVACQLGLLYNKEALLNALIDKSLHDNNTNINTNTNTTNNNFNHIRGLRDVKDLKLTVNLNYSTSNDASMYICPITREEFNGLHSFVVIWSTGFVISEKALKEMGIGGLQADFGPFTSEDVVKLLPTSDEVPIILKKLNDNRENEKVSKKPKKRDRYEQSDSKSNIKEIDSDQIKIKTINNNKPSRINSAINVVSTASKVIDEQTQKSSVYKKLFHTDKDTLLSDRDLFMSVAGIRYTLK